MKTLHNTNLQFNRETEKTIERLFLKMRSARTKLKTYYELELELLESIIACEKEITAVRDKRRKLRLRRKKLIGRFSSENDRLKNTLIDLHEKENELKEFEEAVLRRRTLLKRLGDGLAWILTDYNRAYIRAMGRKEPAGFIFGKSGAELERVALEAVFDEKKQTIGILHDLTNCLRTGDLTVVKYDGTATILRCLELKAVQNELARVRKRERRQEKYGEVIWNYVRTGKSTEVHPGYTTISMRPKLTHHWLKMKLLLLKAKNSGYAYERIDDALLYVAIDPQIIPTEEVVYKLIKQLEPPFTFGCLDRLKDGLFDHEPIFTFELDADQILDIIFERLTLCIFLSLGKLKQLLKKEGYDLVLSPNLSPNPAGLQEGLKIRDEHGEECLIGSYPVEMLIYEGSDVKSFIDWIRISKEI